MLLQTHDLGREGEELRRADDHPLIIKTPKWEAAVWSVDVVDTVLCPLQTDDCNDRCEYSSYNLVNKDHFSH